MKGLLIFLAVIALILLIKSSCTKECVEDEDEKELKKFPDEDHHGPQN